MIELKVNVVKVVCQYVSVCDEHISVFHNK